MSVHVAILKTRYMNMLLGGTKLKECRLSKRAVAPFRRVKPGDVIFFKRSGGGFEAAGVAGEVRFYHGLSQGHVAEIRSRMNHEIGGDDGYWQQKAGRGYATLITVTRLSALSYGPDIAPSHGASWFVLPDTDRLDVGVVELTSGAVRDGYLPGPKQFRFSEAQSGKRSGAEASYELQLPDEQIIRTSITKINRFQWRGWRPYYRAHGAVVGDRVLLVRVSGQRYRVALLCGGA